MEIRMKWCARCGARAVRPPVKYCPRCLLKVNAALAAIDAVKTDEEKLGMAMSAAAMLAHKGTMEREDFLCIAAEAFDCMTPEEAPAELSPLRLVGGGEENG